MWSFQKGCTIRSRPDEPVAIETELEWVLSDTMKNSSGLGEVQSAQVNYVGSSCERRANLESDIHKLLNIETLGITATENEVHEAFERSISFTGER